MVVTPTILLSSVGAAIGAVAMAAHVSTGAYPLSAEKPAPPVVASATTSAASFASSVDALEASAQNELLTTSKDAQFAEEIADHFNEAYRLMHEARDNGYIEEAEAARLTMEATIDAYLSQVALPSAPLRDNLVVYRHLLNDATE